MPLTRICILHGKLRMIYKNSACDQKIAYYMHYLRLRIWLLWIYMAMCQEFFEIQI